MPARLTAPRRPSRSLRFLPVLAVALSACAGVTDTTGGGSSSATAERPTSIGVDLPSVAITGIGSAQTVSITVRNAAGGTLGNPSVVWTSDQPTVASVVGTGTTATITALARGSATVKAQAGTASVSIPVSVRGVQAVTIPPIAAPLRQGDTLVVRASVQADPEVPTTVTWSSSNPGVATVNAAGVVTALTPGTTAIIAAATAQPAATARVELTVWPQRALILRPDTARLARSQSLPISAELVVEPGAATTLRWRSTDPTIASVTQTGIITAVGVGSTTITALADADTMLRRSVTTVVTPIVTGVTIAPTDVQLAPSQSRQLDATVQGDAGINPAVRWSSSNSAIVNVSTQGLVTAIALGSATITATSVQDGARSASITVSVARQPITVAVTPATASVGVGGTTTFTATVTADASANTSVTWQSSNPAVASINRTTGVVTGVAIGSATITATSVEDNNRTASATVTVSSRALTLRPDTVRVMRTQTTAITAELVIDAGFARTLQWRSSNPAIATVSPTGVVTGVAAGTALITAWADADTTVRRTIPAIIAPLIGTFTVSPTSAQLQPNQTLQVTATLTADPGINTGVRWASSNAAIASVSANGLITAAALGSATITATSLADPARTATVGITVAQGPPRLANRWDAARINGAMIEDITSVWCPRPTACFAVSGTTGDLFQQQGTEWRAVPRGAQAAGRRFLAISGNATGTIAVAVGTGGLASRFDGTLWTTMNTGLTTDLLGVTMLNDTQGMAVGVGGTVLRLQGTTWQRLSPPIGNTTLYDVAATTSAWFVSGDNGTLLRLNADQTWTSLPTATSDPLLGVAAAGPTSAIAVGEFGTIIQLNGATTTRVDAGVNVTLNDAIVTPTGQWTIVGDGVALQSANGTNWQRISPPYATRLLSAYFDGTNGLFIGGQRGVVMEQRGTAWSTRNAAPDLLDVWTVDANTAYAVGELGFIHRWNGSAWTRQTAPTTQRLNGVWAANASTVFAVGDSGTLLRTTDGGTTWQLQNRPTSSDIVAVWGMAANAAFAVGVGGELLRWDGTSWTVTGATVPGALYGVFGSSITDVWAVGDAGLVYRSDGGAFARQNTNVIGLFSGVWAENNRNVFAVGQTAQRALMIRWDGGSWQVQSPGTTSILSSIWGPNPLDLYATGANGTIVRFDGARWSPMVTNTTDFLWAISGTADARGGFAVGFNSTVLMASQASAVRASAMRLGGSDVHSFEPDARARRGSRVLPAGRARRAHVTRTGRR
jgi:trimeric autotransporter adhesin